MGNKGRRGWEEGKGGDGNWRGRGNLAPGFISKSRRLWCVGLQPIKRSRTCTQWRMAEIRVIRYCYASHGKNSGCRNRNCLPSTPVASRVGVSCCTKCSRYTQGSLDRGNTIALVATNTVTLHAGPVNTWMGDCLRADTTSRYVTGQMVNSAFHPSAVLKSTTGFSGRG